METKEDLAPENSGGIANRENTHGSLEAGKTQSMEIEGSPLIGSGKQRIQKVGLLHPWLPVNIAVRGINVLKLTFILALSFFYATKLTSVWDNLSVFAKELALRFAYNPMSINLGLINIAVNFWKLSRLLLNHLEKRWALLFYFGVLFRMYSFCNYGCISFVLILVMIV